MQRNFLAIMRFCLSAWVGIAIFFVVVVLDVLDSALSDRLGKYNHPEVFLPPYFAFAFALLGTGAICAIGNLWNLRISLVRRYSALFFLSAALGVAVLDYSLIYRAIAAILEIPTAIPAAKFVELYADSRLLKGVVLALSLVTATLVLWPEHSGSLAKEDSRHDQPTLLGAIGATSPMWLNWLVSALASAAGVDYRTTARLEAAAFAPLIVAVVIWVAIRRLNLRDDPRHAKTPGGTV